MDHFERRGQRQILHAEGMSLDELAARFGTPLYVYSRATITRHVRVLREGLSNLEHIICYAVKANANLAVLELLDSLGCGFDAVSVGELLRVLKIGADPGRVIQSGVGKRDDEIEAALRAGVLYVCVESADELEAVAQIGERLGLCAPVAVRVNPDVDAETHPHIATGMRQNKFGVPYEAARQLYYDHIGDDRIELCGVTCHIGSQITKLEPFEDAARRMASLAGDLLAAGVPLRYLGMGGGLGVPYFDETPPTPDRYGTALAALLGPLQLSLVFEPGRVIVGNAGVLLTRVVRRKRGDDRDFLIVDAGMNDLVRPALYGAAHKIEPVISPPKPSGDEYGGASGPVDIVGPVCESADTFARAIDPCLAGLAAGALLALRTAGAYGFVMGSTYNGRPRPAEVLVDGDRALLIRSRDSLGDLWRGEISLDGTPYDTAEPRVGGGAGD